MPSGASEDQQARRAFVADPAVLAQLEIRSEDLADEDVRAVAIRAEHPECDDALKAGLPEIDGPDGPMNPRLHLAMHQVVATQLWDDSPPEVWETAVRLLDLGYGRHEILHMLGRPVATQLWEASHNHRAYDRDAHLAALESLPGSWERERGARRLKQEHDQARRREAGVRKNARRQAKSSRRRNRRG